LPNGIGAAGEDRRRETPRLDVDVPIDLDVVARLRRLQQLEAHEDSAPRRRTRQGDRSKKQGQYRHTAQRREDIYGPS
jgi:hypothetical protein